MDYLINWPYIIICSLLAFFGTKNKATGFWWALIFSFCFTPIIGALLIYINGKYGESRKLAYTGSNGQKIRIIIYLILADIITTRVALCSSDYILESKGIKVEIRFFIIYYLLFIYLLY